MSNSLYGYIDCDIYFWIGSVGGLIKFSQYMCLCVSFFAFTSYKNFWNHFFFGGLAHLTTTNDADKEANNADYISFNSNES